MPGVGSRGSAADLSSVEPGLVFQISLPPPPREVRIQDFNTEAPGLQMYSPNPTQLHSSPNLGLPTCQFFSNNDSKHRGLL